ncbi:DoxX family protein [soil metagenome]
MAFLKSRLFRLIASIGLAALFFFLCPPCFSKTYLGIVLAILLVIINFHAFFARFRWLTHIARFLVGGLFIFSGFIKANDPVGFSIKLEEYFEVFGQGFSCDMKVEGKTDANIPCAKETHTTAKKVSESSLKPMYDFFAEHSLFLAILICGFEMVLGLFLLLGIQVRWTLLLLLAMIVFFAFLTFYSACCNKVTSCGCFGDAIKLTPWESFWKDLYLLLLISVIFVGERNVKPLFKNRILLNGVAAIGLFASFAFPVYTWRHLPVIDFRPYAIGTNLWDASQRKDPKTTGCQNDSIVMEFYYFHDLKDSATGPYKKFTVDNLPDSTWNYFCRYDNVIRKGNCGATVLDFNITDPESGGNMNDSLLKMKGIQFMLIMFDIDKAERDVMPEVNKFYAACGKNGTPFNALSSASYEQAAAFRKETNATYPMLSVDQTALKTIIRSNPGLMMLKDGVVTAMWHANDFPVYEDVIKKYK